MNRIAQAFGRKNFLLPIQKSIRAINTTVPQRFIIKTLDDVKKEENVRHIKGNCESRRYLLRKDQMGFSFHHTVFYGGKEMFIHYKNHMEAVFISGGRGWIEIVSDKDQKGKGKRHELGPGTMYALDGHESHYLGAYEDMDCICVFVPPCSGEEIQNDDGVFPFIGEDGKLDYDFWSNKRATNEKISIEIKDAEMKAKD